MNGLKPEVTIDEKIFLCLCIACIFTGCKFNNQDEASVEVTNNKLSEEDLDEMENDSDMSAGFYLYDEKDELIPNTQVLNLKKDELNCSLEFMNICKTDINFTLLIFINDELQKFTVNGQKKSYSYGYDNLGYRETNKINIFLIPSIQKAQKENRLTFLMIYNQSDYLDESAFVASVQEEHVIHIEESTNAQVDSVSSNVTYIKDGTTILNNQCKLSISANKETKNYEVQKFIELESNKIFFRMLNKKGKYNSLVIVDGKVEESFNGLCVNEWAQKDGYASLLRANLSLEDSNKHELLFLYYDINDNEAEYNIAPLFVVSKSS